jgi:DNA modification methylase
MYFKTAESEGKVYHKTQKPVILMEYFIKTYTNENDLVLDFTMGSGSTIRACNNLNRNAIGIDNGKCEKEGSEYFGMPWKEIVADLIKKDNK